MKILITGGAGFIGSHIVEHYQEIANEVCVYDHLPASQAANLTGLRHTYIEACITDADALKEALKGVDYVYHMAAFISVPDSFNDKHACITTNVNGTINVLDAARDTKCKRIVIASSAAVYGDLDEPKMIESLKPAPISPYAITKLDCEFYANLYSARHAMSVVSARFFNVYGPRQSYDSAYASVIPAFIKLKGEGLPFTINGDGSQTRDFVYVKDLVAALDCLMHHKNSTGVYNVASGFSVTLNDLTEAITSGATVNYAPERQGDIKHSAADVTKLSNTGWSPSHTLHEGLRHTCDYYGTA
jgi:UDP-glucose 4-epimerase